MKYTIFLVAILLLAEWKLSAQVRCVIRGELPGLQTDEVQLVTATVDYRYHGKRVPVKDHRFEYILELPQVEGYKLIFVTRDPRVWYTVQFMAEDAILDIRVNVDKSYTIAGGTLNDDYQKYLEIQKTKQRDERYMLMYSYFTDHIDELYYFLIIEELQKRQIYDVPIDNQIVGAYTTLAARFPQHSYTVLGKTLIDGFNTIRPGGQYIEFEAPDLKGNMVNISDVIRGKVAVIDLWASWCHPCRLKAKAMIPMYEKYKDKGFVVVGVAREFKNTKKLELAIEKDGYPWLQLLELDDSRQIWTRYMLGTAGGGVFLIDRDGTIIAVNPNPEEMELKLKELLD
ncbi:MAG: TlpA disulfide reductase family protein [Odoribacter sp.]